VELSPTTLRRGYYRCSECGDLFLQSEKLGQHHGTWTENNFYQEVLDVQHGPDGWYIIAEVDPGPEPSRTYSPPEPAIVEAIAPPAEAEPRPDSRASLPRAHGLRPGSKRHRVFKAIEPLLQEHPWMHVDDILSRIESMGEFEEVKDTRTNLFNILSALKSKGLLVSDNRGNWALPP
jgi:hypothetical protein